MKTHVLLVDDNPGDRMLFEIFMERVEGYDFTVEEVGTLSQAVTHLKTASPEVIFIDLHLPDEDGVRCLHAVAELAPDAALIAVTGSDDHQLRNECMVSGLCCHFLPKIDLSAASLKRAFDVATTTQSVRSAPDMQASTDA